MCTVGECLGVSVSERLPVSMTGCLCTCLTGCPGACERVRVFAHTSISASVVLALPLHTQLQGTRAPSARLTGTVLSQPNELSARETRNEGRCVRRQLPFAPNHSCSLPSPSGAPDRPSGRVCLCCAPTETADCVRVCHKARVSAQRTQRPGWSDERPATQTSTRTHRHRHSRCAPP